MPSPVPPASRIRRRLVLTSPYIKRARFKRAPPVVTSATNFHRAKRDLAQSRYTAPTLNIRNDDSCEIQQGQKAIMLARN
jgi:hypothetical protein